MYQINSPKNTAILGRRILKEKKKGDLILKKDI
jgi:hypothetical protein